MGWTGGGAGVLVSSREGSGGVVVVGGVVLLASGMGRGFPEASRVASWYRCLSLSRTMRWRVSNVRFSRWNLGMSSFCFPHLVSYSSLLIVDSVGGVMKGSLRDPAHSHIRPGALAGPP